jgi:hypothetical protein
MHQFQNQSILLTISQRTNSFTEIASVHTTQTHKHTHTHTHTHTLISRILYRGRLRCSGIFRIQYMSVYIVVQQFPQAYLN